MHLVDWWQPRLVFDTFIAIEDLLFGFACAGTIAGLYFLLRSTTSNYIPLKKSYLGILVVLFLFCLFGLFYIFHIHSFWASLIALSLPVLVVLTSRPLRLPKIFLTGILITIIACAGYLFALSINPDYVKETYLFEYLSGKLFAGIPVEELWWFFFAGIGIPSWMELTWE